MAAAEEPSSPGGICSGIAAGRGAALGALLRVLCAKRSHENIPETQLARFLALLHEVLAEVCSSVLQSPLQKERVVLCSLLFYGERLFTLGLPGVETFLPSFIVATDIVLTESHSVRLHPSFSDVEMRAASLRVLATLISWPTVFGVTPIPRKSSSASQMFSRFGAPQSQVVSSKLHRPTSETPQEFDLLSETRD